MLDADGLGLRPWHVDDAAVVVTAYEDPDIRRWLTRSMNLDEATAWVTSWAGRWQAETGAGWALVRDGAIAVQIILRSLDHGDGRSDIS